ncbi:NADAR family protein [Dictyobacter kobayashii]|uniref:NADAR family protein n=1 Tax=Dictyobacter kobayashii TaxID=2014872 RepID=UPI001386A8C3|nr:NADAR family protein [Dictyobacter kobayashii]
MSDLKVYADGMIDCWGLVDLATFRQQVASGWVATTFPQGARGHADDLVMWEFDEPWTMITAEGLIAEVADEIEYLAGRPTLEERCLAALDRYVEAQDAERLAVLREAYLAVPEHQRRFLLHDQDAKDWPLRTILTPIGESVTVRPDGTPEDPVEEADHEAAMEYFRRSKAEDQRFRAAATRWQDAPVTASPSVVRFQAPKGEALYLANDYPAPITLDGRVYATVEHAYWALATTDADAREQIIQAQTAGEAQKIGQQAPLRADWNVVRLAVMTRLVRAKFQQHPDLAERLMATGDGRLLNGQDRSRYWGALDQGRNWLGRILELVRAELVESAHS